MKTTIDFCGEIYPLEPGDSITLGREGDIVIDGDNPYLHRHFITISLADGGIPWLHNVGARMSATVADSDGLTQTWLAPDARIPLVFPRTTVWFTAGPTTYGFDVLVDDPPLTPAPSPAVVPSQDTTIGATVLTPDQRLLVVALAESVLRRGPGGKGQIPSTAQAAQRLGWTTTKFNRKLDNVCEKLAKLGVTGLVGGAGRHASSRRVRLVEYAVATRLVTSSDLGLLDQPPI